MIQLYNRDWTPPAVEFFLSGILCFSICPDVVGGHEIEIRCSLLWRPYRLKEFFGWSKITKKSGKVRFVSYEKPHAIYCCRFLPFFGHLCQATQIWSHHLWPSCLSAHQVVRPHDVNCQLFRRRLSWAVFFVTWTSTAQDYSDYSSFGIGISKNTKWFLHVSASKCQLAVLHDFHRPPLLTSGTSTGHGKGETTGHNGPKCGRLTFWVSFCKGQHISYIQI